MQEDIYDGWSEGTPGSVDRWMTAVYGLGGIDEVLSRTYHDGTTAGTFYHVFDPQFSTLAILQSTGRVRECVEYSAFGHARHHQYADIDGDGAGADQAAISHLGLSGQPPLSYHLRRESFSVCAEEGGRCSDEHQKNWRRVSMIVSS